MSEGLALDHTNLNNELGFAPQNFVDASLRFLDIELDWLAHRVIRGGRLLHLSTLHVRLLRFLMLSPTRVFTRSEILQNVWPQDVFVLERTVDVHIAVLRKALDVPGRTNPVRTVRGRGYSLDAFEPLPS
jgi:two-component system phosphate regulon response regulator PhoB